MVDAAHRGGVVVVPPVELLGADAVRLLEAPGQRLDQMTFRIFRSCAQRESDLEMLEGNFGEAIGLGLAVVAPGEVVEGPRTVGDAPMGHDAIRIELERPVEALHALFLVEAEAPVQAEIEPALRLGGRRPDLPRVGAEIEAVHFPGLLIVKFSGNHPNHRRLY